jgi:hypothetical protein
MKFFPVPQATLLTMSFLLLFGSQFICFAQQEKTETKRILVMFSFHEGLPWEELIDKSLRTSLATASDLHIELNIENTDRTRYTEEMYLKRLEDLCCYK